MLDVHPEKLTKTEHLRLTPYKGKHDNGAGVLKLCVLIELVEDYLTVRVLAVLHDHFKTVTSAFVTDFGNALDTLLMDEVRHSFDKLRLLHHVGDFGDDNAVVLLLDVSL